MDLLKTLYEVAGAPWPRLSLALAALVGALLFGTGWWLIGKQYQKEQVLKREEPPTVSAPAPIKQSASSIREPDEQERITQMREAGYAWLSVVRDSLGNRNVNSWGKGQGGDWSDALRTTVHVGDRIRISAEAVSPSDNVEFQFSLQPAGGGFEARRAWSTAAQWTWAVQSKDIGRHVVIMIAVRRPKSFYQFGDVDDYTYAVYDVLPARASSKAEPGDKR